MTLSGYFEQIAHLSPIPILQYRNKQGTIREKRDDLIAIRQYYQGTLIVNDTIALIDYADGIHLGQEDLQRIDPDPHRAVTKVRQTIGRKLLGLSTHNREEILQANQLDLDYIGLGAYRPTQTKQEAAVGGQALLEIAKLSKHPVGIIGGVRIEDHFDPPVCYKVIGSGLLG